MSTLTLSFDIQSTWHIGSGETGGAYADNLCLKNADHLPYIPGRAVKGLLRDAFKVAEANNWFTKSEGIPNLEDYIFGSEGQGIEASGILQISSAQLSPAEYAYFTSTPKSTYELYRVLYSTAIDHKTGTAQAHSLRSIEVALPMVLHADIFINNHPEKTDLPPKQVLSWLAQASTLITGIGAKRKRGLGQVVVTAAVTNEVSK